MTTDSPEPEDSTELDSLRATFEATLGLQFYDGNRVEVLRNGDEIFPAMLSAIAEAESTIDFLTFVYWSGEIAEQFASALTERARNGVRVRVLLDAFGSLSMPDRLRDQMRAAGAEVELFRPLGWRFWRGMHRTHRKIMVCDKRVGFTGGVGIAEEWTGDARNPEEWRETHFEIRGPAVMGLRAAFMVNWIECVGRHDLDSVAAYDHDAAGSAAIQVIRSSASVEWSDAAYALRLCLSVAKRSVRITTAYFVPDDESVRLLVAAAGRGVEIDIMLPGPHTDSRLTRWGAEDRFTELLESGVRLRQYQRTMLHAKLMTVDGHLSCVGSANYNHRSLSEDDEVLLVVIDRGLATTLEEQFREDCESCVAVKPRAWKRRAAWRRVRELFARLLRRNL